MIGDDFSSSSLNTALWTFEDPRGNCSVSQSSGQLNMVVSNANTHDFYFDGINACRITQPAKDRHFIVTVKMDGIVTTNYQLGGLSFYVSDTLALRWDRYYSATMHLYCSIINAGTSSETAYANINIGTATVEYLRTTRVDNTWTCDYSADGTSWTNGATFTDSSIAGMTKWGIHGGNGAAGSWTELVDWVTVVTDPKQVTAYQTVQRSVTW